MARKKKQPAQDVQENTIDTSEKLPDPKDVKIDTAFDIAGAGFLIHKAAEYYGKPLNETTLADAFDMMQEENRAEAIKGLMTDQQLTDLDEMAKKLVNTTAEKLGKDPNTVTIADIESLTHNADTLTDDALDYMSLSIAVSQSAQELTDIITQTVKRITSTPEYIAAVEFTKKTKAFLAAFSEHAEEFAEITGRAKEFYAEKLPFVIWELGDRMGETILFDGETMIFDGEAVHWSLEYIKALLNAPEKPSTEKTPFEQEIDRVLDQFSFTGAPETEYARELLEAAARRKIAYDEYTADVEALTNAKEAVLDNPPEVVDAEQLEKLTKELPRIIAQQAENLNYPLDKPNSKIWNLLTTADENGQLSFAIDTAKKGSGKEALIYYSIDFTALESLPELNITKQLTPFDKRVYIIAAALFNAGNTVVTATQIYRADHDKEPSPKDIQKINDSLTKMGAAHIYIDNKNEISVNKKYPKFKYDASLLPFERMSAYINGQLTETAIHLLREPPLITFARERKQITTIDRQLLLAPVSKTDANLRIEDYLIERISHMKSPHSRAPRKLLYATIFENCGITEKKQRQRAPEKIRRYLDYYIECGLIKDYTETKEGITIEL